MTHDQINCKKIWLIWILTLVFSFQMTSCTLLAREEYTANSRIPTTFRIEDGKGIAQAQLDSQEAELYDQIDAQLQNYTREISQGLEKYSDDTIVKVYMYVLIDHPEYFWLRDGYLLKSASGLFHKKKVLEPLYAIDPKKSVHVKCAWNKFEMIFWIPYGQWPQNMKNFSIFMIIL